MSGPTLEALLTASHRSAHHVARNGARHPVETLTFFGLQPTMTVLEVLPAFGWYTEILAPYLADQGRLYVGTFAGGLWDGFLHRTLANSPVTLATR